MKRIIGVFVGLFALVAVMQSAPADAATRPSSWTWTGTRVYTAGQAWELDSPNQVYRAVWQTDHNLVIYHGSKALWSSATSRVTLDKLVFTAANYSGLRGNMGVGVYCTSPCAYSASDKQWDNEVNDGTAVHRIVMQNDGNFVEYTGSSGGRALWATNTRGR
jgi:hypothetical protein